MVRFDVEPMRHMDKEHFRVLLAIEMGMKNHEAVPLQLISMIASIYRGGCSHLLRDLNKMKLVYHEKGRKYDGYRLTTLGYDYLALHTLRSRNVVASVGNQIGVGKESDVYVGGDADLNDLVLKFSRLGRTSFRKLKEKRDYHGKRQHCSWLYLSRISALKEFSFLKALHAHGFPVPAPIDVCRHTVVMGLVDGVPLYKLTALDNPGDLYDRLMNLIVRLAEYGLIHGDFNEFNIMITDELKVFLIDFPQMTSTDHPNAQYYFDRDVECIREFFRKKLQYESYEFPTLDSVKRRHCLDADLAATGFTKAMSADLCKLYEERCNLEKSDVDETEEEGEGDYVDQQEQKEAEDDMRDKKEELCSTTRFSDWLKDAQEQVSKLSLDEDFKDIVDNSEQHRAGELIGRSMNVVVPRAPNQETPKVEPKSSASESDNNSELECASDLPELQRGKVTRARGVYEDGSTIAPQDIRKRLLTEKQKTHREKFRAKGKQSAVRRGRKANSDVVKEFKGWEF